MIGAEADAAYTDLRKDLLLGGLDYHSRTEYVGTARGRLGIAFGELLIYGTGGFAYGGVTNSVGPFNADTIRTGFAYGGGLEYAIPTTSFVNVFPLERRDPQGRVYPLRPRQGEQRRHLRLDQDRRQPRARRHQLQARPVWCRSGSGRRALLIAQLRLIVRKAKPRGGLKEASSDESLDKSDARLAGRRLQPE